MKINRIVAASATANEIQIPFSPRINNNNAAKPQGKINPSSSETIEETEFF